MRLHAPKSGEYRKHIYEDKTLCHKRAWIANAGDRVTCDHCRRKLKIDPNQGLLDVIEDLAA